MTVHPSVDARFVPAPATRGEERELAADDLETDVYRNGELDLILTPSAKLSVAVPAMQWDRDFVLLAIAVIGTTIAPWMQFYQQAAVVDKKLKLKDYFFEKVDIVFGTTVTDIVAFFIIVACASTLFVHNIRVETAVDAAVALKPLAGKYASALFAIGLFNAYSLNDHYLRVALVTLGKKRGFGKI